MRRFSFVKAIGQITRRLVRGCTTSILLLLFASFASCAEEEPRFGKAGSIKDRKFPDTSSVATGGEGGASTTSSLFPKAFDPANPPSAGEPLAPRHVAFRVLDDKVDCLQCHGAQGPATNRWAFGGRVSNKTGDVTAIREVIVTNLAGTEVIGHVKATSDGYFWKPGPPVANTRTAVRTQTDEAEMNTSATGACNSAGCHGGAVEKITVPE